MMILLFGTLLRSCVKVGQQHKAMALQFQLANHSANTSITSHLLHSCLTWPTTYSFCPYGTWEQRYDLHVWGGEEPAVNGADALL